MATWGPADERRRRAFRERITRWAEEHRERDQRAKELIWERVESAKGPRPALTHEQIARAAVEIADADGLKAVTMRSLAQRLGVATMSLYRYVSGKDDVYELMADIVTAEIDLPSGDWRTVAESFARQHRASCLRHSWLIQVFTLVPNALTPASMDVTERALAAIDGLGLDIDAMMAAFGTIGAFVRGLTVNELAVREMLRSHGWTSENDVRAAYVPYVRWMIESRRYPLLTRYVVEGSNQDDAEWRFEFGLQCVLDGVAARLGI